MNTSKAKKIIITPEEVASSSPRKSRSAKTVQASAGQVLELNSDSIDTSSGGVTFIQVNELGEVSTIEGASLLGQENIQIQITGEDEASVEEATATTASAVLETAIPLEDDQYPSFLIQPPESYRRELLDLIEANLTKCNEKYADLAIFCSDGIVWSSKLVLASASTFVKDLLLSVPNIDDTCLVLPFMTKLEFLTFQSALFSKDDTQPSDMYSVIKGCDMLGIDLEDQINYMSNVTDEPPTVEYASVLANPFEKKRIYKGLGYVPMDGFTDQVANDDVMKGIGPILRVLEDNYKCKECDRTFFDASSLESHVKMMHSSYTIEKLVKGQDKYNCPICSRTFGFAVNLKKHFWFCHSTSGADIRIRSAQVLPLALPMPSKKDKLNEKMEDMKCSICSKLCSNWKTLEVHMLLHTNENPFKCKICDRGFRVSLNFRTTIFRHQNIFFLG